MKQIAKFAKRPANGSPNTTRLNLLSHADGLGRPDDRQGHNGARMTG